MKISVNVQDVSKKLYLRQEVGECRLDSGTVIDITQVIPTGDLHFHVLEGKSYLISLKDVLDALIEAGKIK